MTTPSLPDLTLTQMLRAHAQERPDALALRQKDFGIWQAYSWRDYYNRARHFGLGLRAMGLEEGGHVAIISGGMGDRPDGYWHGAGHLCWGVPDQSLE